MSHRIHRGSASAGRKKGTHRADHAPRTPPPRLHDERRSLGGLHPSRCQAQHSRKRPRVHCHLSVRIYSLRCRRPGRPLMSAPAPAPFPSPPWGGTRRRAVRWEPPPQTPLPALPVTGWGRHHPESMKRWVCRSSMRNRLPPQIDYTVAAPYLRFLPTPPLPSPSCPSPCRPCCADAPRPVPDPHATLYSHHSYLLASRIDACWPTRAAAADTIRGAPPPLPCKRLSRRPARCSRQSVRGFKRTNDGGMGGGELAAVA